MSSALQDPGRGADLATGEPVPPWIAGRAMTQSRWLRVVFGWCVGSGALTMPLLGQGGAVAMVATLALWAALLTALATWSTRQELIWRRLTAAVVVPAAAWLVGYAVAVGLGLWLWRGVGWAWFVTALATVAVPVAAAELTRRWSAHRAGSR